MPELPEAETIARQLAREITGRTIREVVVRSPRAIRSHQSRAEFAHLVEGKKISGLGRRGKAVLVFLGGRAPLIVVVRLGMSGRLQVCASGEQPPRYLRALFRLSGGRELHFIDPRQFGLLVAREGTAADEFPEFKSYGPEPLSSRFTASYLASALSRRSIGLAIALMDQRLVAGIGKIYTDEICFRAGLAPTRPANSLSEEDCRRLRKAMRAVLRSAIRFLGTSTGDIAYLDAYGNQGGFRKRLTVYQRTGLPCRICGAPIRRERIPGGRGLHWCVRCQR